MKKKLLLILIFLAIIPSVQSRYYVKEALVQAIQYNGRNYEEVAFFVKGFSSFPPCTTSVTEDEESKELYVGYHYTGLMVGGLIVLKVGDFLVWDNNVLYCEKPESFNKRHKLWK